MNNFVKELTWRGMVHNIMPGTEEQLQKEQTAAYVGIDPTADSLHIGHLVSIMMLKHFQACGHKPVALVGGATGMIGDPSMKSSERNLLDEETLRYNQNAIKNQLSRFLDFDSDTPNAAILVNNYDWMKDYTFLQFIRDVGKHITVNYMMSKDSVKKRITGHEREGMSFTEFTYQLVQGYDYFYLYQNYNCKLQMGGSDQWGNITTGTELIRRKAGGDAFALTCPLIAKADGGKFGKTENGNIWLDSRYTTPYAFYQFWLNVSDEDAKKYIKIFTMLGQEEIESAIEGAKELNVKFVFIGLSPEAKSELMELFPNRFDYKAVRDSFDYVYESEKLISLSGKKLQSKRNYINRFKELPNWQYEELTDDKIQEVIGFNSKWCKEVDCDKNESLGWESCAVAKCLTNYPNLNLKGGILRTDGEIVAYTIGEPINSDTVIIHIEKAFAEVKGAYPMINREFAERVASDYKYINREDDAGDQGLRQAKESYCPVFMQEKYAAYLF